MRAIVPLRQREQAELRLETPYLLTISLPLPPSAEAAPASLAPAEEEGAAGDWGPRGMGALTPQEGWTNEQLVRKQQNLAMPPDGLFQNHSACSSADSAWRRTDRLGVSKRGRRGRGLCFLLLLVSHALPTNLFRPKRSAAAQGFHVCALPPCCAPNGKTTSNFLLRPDSMSDFQSGKSLT